MTIHTIYGVGEKSDEKQSGKKGTGKKKEWIKLHLNRIVIQHEKKSLVLIEKNFQPKPLQSLTAVISKIAYRDEFTAFIFILQST